MPRESAAVRPVEVFRCQFDLVIPKSMATFSKTLSQHEIFKLVQKQLKASFDTDVCHVQNFKINRKTANDGLDPKVEE